VLTVLFVHGTGVRAPEFEHTLAAIKRGLAHVSMITVAGCDWGTVHGALAGHLSIPNYGQAKAIDNDLAHDPLVDLWGQLVSDPFLEIRLVAKSVGDHQSLFGEHKTLEQCEADVLDALGGEDLPPSLPRDLNVATMVASVIAVFTEGEVEDAWRQAVTGGSSREDDVASGAFMLARAIVAYCMIERFAQGFPAIPGEQRDIVVEWIASAMSGATGQSKGLMADTFQLAMAPVRKLGTGALRLGAHLGTAALRSHRSAVSDFTSLRIGDILLYQARGQAIRKHIEEHILAAGNPVLLLGHSLGGIACVDLLAMTKGLPVAGLVTVGSQGAYLYELGALSSVEQEEPLPDHFPPWLNFYDLNDLLSYLAKPVFGAKVIEDVEIKSGQPFPVSHGAYWTNSGLWERVRVFAESLLK